MLPLSQLGRRIAESVVLAWSKLPLSWNVSLPDRVMDTPRGLDVLCCLYGPETDEYSFPKLSYGDRTAL